MCVAHGTSLRGIVKHIENLTDDEICHVDLPNGIPILYRYRVSCNKIEFYQCLCGLCYPVLFEVDVLSD